MYQLLIFFPFVKGIKCVGESHPSEHDAHSGLFSLPEPSPVIELRHWASPVKHSARGLGGEALHFHTVELSSRLKRRR